MNPDPAARRPRIVLVIPRGEAIRNFVQSSTLGALAERADVLLLSVVTDASLLGGAGAGAAELVPLREFPVSRGASIVRQLTENAHDRWLWSAVAQNNWELRDRRAVERGERLRRLVLKVAARALAFPAALELLTRLERRLVWNSRPPIFDQLFDSWRPDLVFNGSHIHGMAGELPTRVASRRGIRTAGFVFSWDNLTSRSRILVPYDHYLVWHEPMKRQLLAIYRRLLPGQVHVTGTPQFDPHFDQGLGLSRDELCRRIGIDAKRPFILWTTGIDNHFFDEHLHLEAVIAMLAELPGRPQLVVRTYVKGTSPELRSLAARGLPDVVFPEVLWDPEHQTPRPEDLAIYTNMLRHCAVGVNAASTVSLELLIHDKPVINLDFDPPGSSLPWCLGYQRHIRFDHFRPIAESGATMVASSVDDMRRFLARALTEPSLDQAHRRTLLERSFGAMLDGRSGDRVAATLAQLAAP